MKVYEVPAGKYLIGDPFITIKNRLEWSMFEMNSVAALQNKERSFNGVADNKMAISMTAGDENVTLEDSEGYVYFCPSGRLGIIEGPTDSTDSPAFCREVVFEDDFKVFITNDGTHHYGDITINIKETE